jgi:flagellar hook-associated protein 1 FlgK
MSLILALKGAVSGIRTNQQALAILTQNITNANSEGYSRQVVTQSQQIVGGLGGGVRIENVQRAVDQFLMIAARKQAANVGTQQAKVDYLSGLQVLYGQPGAGNDLKTYADNFFSSLRELSNSPEQNALRTQAVTSADFLAKNISGLSTAIYQARFDADREVDQVVDDINNILDTLASTNAAIKEVRLTGGVTAGRLNSLFDRRDQSLRELNGYMDVIALFNEDGTVNISTQNSDLLNENRYHLQYKPLGRIEDFIDENPLSAIEVTLLDFDGNPTDVNQTLVTGGVASEVTTNLKQGRLLGLIQARDVDLPRQLAQLDEFASKLRDQVNTLHNKGVGYPPPQTLTGTRLTTLAEERSFTGSTRIAALNANGKPITSPYPTVVGGLRPLEIDFSTVYGPSGVGSPTTADIMREINSYFTHANRAKLGNLTDIKLAAVNNNIATNGTFTFDLDLDNATSANALVQVVGIASPDPGITFSAIPAALGAGLTIAAGDRKRFTGNDITADFSGAVGPGPHVIQVDILVDGVPSTIEYTVAENISDVRNNRYSATGIAAGIATLEIPTSVNPLIQAQLVDASGNISVTGEGYLQLKGFTSDIRVGIDELDSRDAGEVNDSSTATSRGFSYFFELNNFFNSGDNETRNSSLNLALEDRIISNKGLFATGRMIASFNTGSSPLYTYETSISNSDNIAELAGLALSQIEFDEAGTLPESKLSFTAYLAEILGFSGQTLSNAENVLANEQILQDALDEKLDGARGVNIDEELANSVLFQSSYQAVARMIGIVDELFQQLIEST